MSTLLALGLCRVPRSKIEQQFLPAKLMDVTPLIGGGQRAHKIVIRNGRMVDVTEEEEDHLAITALKKAEEHARASPAPSRPPYLAVERVSLPRGVPASPRQLMSVSSPRGSNSAASPRTTLGSTPVSAAVPVVVSLREIRAAVAECYSEVRTVNLAPSVVQHAEEILHVATATPVSFATPVTFSTASPIQTAVPFQVSAHTAVPVHVPKPVSTVVVMETVTTSTSTTPPVPAKEEDRTGELWSTTVDGAAHPILSVDFSDREMSDAELVPELARLPTDRTLVLLLNGNDMLREGAS